MLCNAPLQERIGYNLPKYFLLNLDIAFLFLYWPVDEAAWARVGPVESSAVAALGNTHSLLSNAKKIKF